MVGRSKVDLGVKPLPSLVQGSCRLNTYSSTEEGKTEGTKGRRTKDEDIVRNKNREV